MRHAWLVGLVALAVGCRDQGPVLLNGLPSDVALAVTGAWTLATVDGAALPWKEADGFECPPNPADPCVPAYRVDVVAGTLTLNTSGTWSRVTQRRTTYLDGRPATETSGTITGTYTGSMDTGPVTLKFHTPDNPFDPTWTGTLNGTTLALVGFAEPLGYTR